MRNVHTKELEKYLCENPSLDEATALEFLKNKGNYMHNVKVIREKIGQLIVIRRPTTTVSYKEFLPCPKCLGFLGRKDLWRHKSSCDGGSKETQENKCINANRMILYSSINKSHSEVQMYVVESMRKDDVYLVFKNDDLILAYGSFIFDSKGLPHKNYISEKMRNLARFLVQIRKDMRVENGSLSDFISNNYFNSVLSAAKTVCGYGLNEDEEKTSKIPSLALKLGHALKKCAVLKQGLGISHDNAALEKEGKKFMKLHAIHWSNSISSTALKALGTHFFQWDKSLHLKILKKSIFVYNYKSFCHIWLILSGITCYNNRNPP